MKPSTVPAIDEAKAIELATRFIGLNRETGEYGAVTTVSHKPPFASGRNNTGQTTGSYHVEFAYSGPSVPRDRLPRRDHPTVVVVNDATGACTFMRWM